MNTETKEQDEIKLIIEMLEIKSAYYKKHYQLTKDDIDLRYSVICQENADAIKAAKHKNKEYLDTLQKLKVD